MGQRRTFIRKRIRLIPAISSIQLVEEGRKSIFYVVKTNYDGGTGGVSMNSSKFLYLNGENLFGENVRRGKLRHLAKIFVTFPRRKFYPTIEEKAKKSLIDITALEDKCIPPTSPLGTNKNNIH